MQAISVRKQIPITPSKKVSSYPKLNIANPNHFTYVLIPNNSFHVYFRYIVPNHYHQQPFCLLPTDSFCSAPARSVPHPHIIRSHSHTLHAETSLVSVLTLYSYSATSCVEVYGLDV